MSLHPNFNHDKSTEEDYIQSNKLLLDKMILNHEHAIKNRTADDKQFLLNLNNLLNDFIIKFPQGEQNIIHFRDTSVYTFFRRAVVNALHIGLLNKDDKYFIKCQKTQHCVEELLLQAISKLQIPLDTKVYEGKPFEQPENLATYVNKLAFTTDQYYQRQYGNYSYTLSLLAHMDINKIKQPIIKSLVDTIKQKVNSDLNRDLPITPDNRAYQRISKNIVRVMHSSILLSKEGDRFKTHINNELAKTWLDKIQDIELDNKIAKQLFQIRNIYPKVFPPQLSAKIDPFLLDFKQSTHGSNFERVVTRHLNKQAQDVAVKYPSLIQMHDFDYHNPINDALGLESDIAYNNPFVKVSLQVDGDKYHCHPTVNAKDKKQINQQTKLRDYSFKNDGWQQIVISDANSKDNLSNTLHQEMFNKIVLPTFEAKLTNNLQKIAMVQNNAVALVNRCKEMISQVSKLDAHFHFLKMQLTEKLNKIMNDLSDKIALMQQYQSENHQYSKISTLFDNLKKQMRSHEEEINTLKNSLASLNTDEINNDIAKIQEILTEKTHEYSSLNTDIPALSAKINSLEKEKKARLGKPRDPKAIPINELKDKIARKNSKLAAMKVNKSLLENTIKAKKQDLQNKEKEACSVADLQNQIAKKEMQVKELQGSYDVLMNVLNKPIVIDSHETAYNASQNAVNEIDNTIKQKKNSASFTQFVPTFTPGLALHTVKNSAPRVMEQDVASPSVKAKAS